MKITVPMVVLAVGLATGAQVFAQAAPKVSTDTRSTTVLSDGKSEVRVESDGTTAKVSLNGKVVATLDMTSGWTEHKVVDANGTVVATLWRPEPGSSAITAALGDHDEPMHTRELSQNAWRSRGVDWSTRLSALANDEEVQEALGKAREEMKLALKRVGREMPKVMVGVTMNDVPAEMLHGKGFDPEKSVLIETVVENGPAAKAGLRSGDVIVAFDGGESADAGAISAALKDNNPGDVVSVTFVRSGETKEATITLEPYQPELFGLQYFGGSGSSAPRWNQFMLDDEDIDRIQAEIAELSAKLASITEELATAVGDRAQELSRMTSTLGAQIAQQAAELARRSAREFKVRLNDLDVNAPRMNVRVVPDGPGGQQEVLVFPAPTPPAAPSGLHTGRTPAPGQTQMQERLDRLEADNAELKAMVRELLEQQKREKSGGNH